MGAATKISWADHTWSPWIGCQKVSAGCANCYAEAWAKRFGRNNWGPHGRRQQTAAWGDPLTWNRAAEAAGVRRRIFCGQLCDVFEDHPIANELRPVLWQLIRRCTSLDWLLLTKRPENILRMLPPGFSAEKGKHVWFGTSIENQALVNERISHLFHVPAAVRFLSIEPLLEPIDLRGGPQRRGEDVLCNTDEFAAAVWRAHTDGYCSAAEAVAAIEKHRVGRGGRPWIDWVICGGESGAAHRPMDIAWARSLREQCRDAGVPFFFKQGAAVKAGEHEDALGEVVQEFPR